MVTHWEGCISTVGSRLDGGGGGGEGHCSTYEVRVFVSAAGLGDVVDDAKSSNCGASSVPVRVIEKQLASPLRRLAASASRALRSVLCALVRVRVRVRLRLRLRLRVKRLVRLD